MTVKEKLETLEDSRIIIARNILGHEEEITAEEALGRLDDIISGHQEGSDIVLIMDI